MKKDLRSVIAIALVGLMMIAALGLAACANSNQADSDQADNGATNDSKTQSGVVNPMTEVDGPDAFVSELGISLQPDPAGTNPQFTIIDGRVAQVEYDIAVGSEKTQARVTVRIQKTATAEDISGMYNNYSMVEPGQAVGDVIPMLSYNEGEDGYVMWYDSAQGISGSAAVSTGATATVLDGLAELFVSQNS
jgi:hypothetical protein